MTGGQFEPVFRRTRDRLEADTPVMTGGENDVRVLSAVMDAVDTACRVIFADAAPQALTRRTTLRGITIRASAGSTRALLVALPIGAAMWAVIVLAIWLST